MSNTSQIDPRERMNRRARRPLPRARRQRDVFLRRRSPAARPRAARCTTTSPAGRRSWRRSARYAGDFIAGAGLAAALEQKDPAAAIRDFATVWRGVLRRSDFTAGCPIVSATLEGERSPAARDAAGAAFRRWEELLADGFAQQEIPPIAPALSPRSRSPRSRGRLPRAQRTSEPLERVAGELEALVGSVAAGS